MRIAFALCAFALLACKREEDPPQQTTAATATATTSSAAISNGPTQLVALTQPTDSSAPAASLAPSLAPMQVAATAPATTTSGPTANARAPSVTVGTVMSNGIPPESVQRVMRQNIARYRQCYDGGLRSNPALHGRVMVRMTIDASGSISSAEDAGSDLQDSTVVNCVFGTLGTVTFPQPEAGSATATVPIVFSPPP